MKHSYIGRECMRANKQVTTELLNAQEARRDCINRALPTSGNESARRKQTPETIPPRGRPPPSNKLYIDGNIGTHAL